MSRQQSWLSASVAVLYLTPLLNGCGSGATPVTRPATVSTPSNLNGNWLLTGSLPFTPVLGNPLNSTFGAAATISVEGNNLVATLDRNDVCGGGATSGPVGVVSGPVASDGTFTMASVATVLASTATLSGTVPATAASSWSGHLNLTDNTTFCTATRSIDFSAVRIADVTGTYSGTATLSGILGGSQQNAALTFNLQQGNIAPGTAAFNASLLSGTITVQGYTCFSSGSLPLPVLSPAGGIAFISSVQGSEVALQATMNNGSTVVLLGYIMDTSSSNIHVVRMLGTGGTCGTISSSEFTLTKL